MCAHPCRRRRGCRCRRRRRRRRRRGCLSAVLKTWAEYFQPFITLLLKNSLIHLTTT